LPISTFGLGRGEGRLLGEVFLGILRGFGWGFHFLKDGQAKGLGDHDFSFSFGGRVCFSFRVGGFTSLNIYFWLLECRGHLNLFEVFYFFIIECGFMF
jgi:hypothetical protein